MSSQKEEIVEYYKSEIKAFTFLLAASLTILGFIIHEILKSDFEFKNAVSEILIILGGLCMLFVSFGTFVVLVIAHGAVTIELNPRLSNEVKKREQSILFKNLSDSGIKGSWLGLCLLIGFIATTIGFIIQIFEKL